MRLESHLNNSGELDNVGGRELRRIGRDGTSNHEGSRVEMKIRVLFSFTVGLGLLTQALMLPGCNTPQRGVWELVHSESSSHAAEVQSVIFNSEDEGLVLRWTELSKVIDKGKTWVPVLNAEDGHKMYGSLTFTRYAGFLVGSQRRGDIHSTLVLETSDRGKSWQEIPTNARTTKDRHEAPELYGVAFCGEKDGWAVGRDIILHTSDGHAWQSQKSGIELDSVGLYSVACSGAQRAWAVGAGGLVLRTVDGGNSWTRQDVATTDSLNKVKFFEKDGWIVGGSPGKSLLLRTFDGGETWQQQSLNVGAQLFDICFIGSQGWIVGDDGTILHSTDGGRTWSRQVSPTDEALTCLFFLSPSRGWAGGNRGTLLRFSN